MIIGLCQLDSKMDRLSSPTAIASTATIRPSSTVQPTYTTAGTVYKPNSTQPLQPPARRGRSFKWANGGLHTELSLLPKSVLATLPLRGAANRASALQQQYSPLQQNYDRALDPGSPFVDTDHALVKMPLQGPPTSRTDNSSALSSLFAGSSEDRAISQCDKSETDDSDDEVGMDPLAGMPFKSLQNLASYPNPMQLKARKVLNVAKPIIQVSDQKVTPPGTAYLRPIGSPPKGFQKTELQRDDTLKLPPGLSTGQRLFETKPGPTTLAEGPGVPRPLTAGPPGQRQYRPVTFEATWKALQTKAQQNTDAESITSENVQPCHSQSFGSDQWMQWTQYQSCPIPRVDSVMGNSSLNEESNSAKCDWPSAQPQYSNLSTPVLNNFTAATDTITGKDDNTFEDSKPQGLSRFVPGTDRLTDDEIKAQDERNNTAWNSGAGLLNKSTAEAISDARFRRFEQNHGVIGDGRPGKKAAVYPPMSIEEANALSTARHAKPLLNIAFDTLLRYRDHDFNKHKAAQAPSHMEVKASRFV